MLFDRPRPGQRYQTYRDNIVELGEPPMDGYEIKVPLDILDGEMPKKGGPNALLIDLVDHSLTPVSVAGAHHRGRRRTGAAAPVY
ncbi:MAG: hypothetical protein U9N80_14350 [Chloroflexota bacterium]|nr:hypothetical protein [Chloroflexota bacterium]